MLNVHLSGLSVLSFSWICDAGGSELLLATYRVLGVEARPVQHQQLNHLKSVDSHGVVHRCVSVLDRTLAEVTNQSVWNNITVIISLM